MGELWSMVVVCGEDSNSSMGKPRGRSDVNGGDGWHGRLNCVLRGGHGWNRGLSGQRRGGGRSMTCH